MRVFNALEDGGVGEGGDGVRFARECDLVAVFGNAACVNGGLESGEVGGGEGEEGDMVGDLVLNGVDGGVGDGGRAEEGVDFGGGEDLVDVVELERFGGG